MSGYGVTVQPIALQFGQVSGFSGPSVAGGGGGGGGGGGAIVLLPLLASLFAPLFAGGPAGPPAASPPPPPVAVGEVVQGGPAAPERGAPPAGVVAAAGPSVVRPAPVVLTQGPTRTGATPRRVAVASHRAHPPLPFTGENLWVPLVSGLQLIGIGAVLRYGLGAFGRGRRRSRN